MQSDNVTPVSGELTSPRFDTVATNRAHPVVPLTNARSRRGALLSAMRRVRPAVLVFASLLVAAVMVAAGTAIYKHQQSTLPASAGVDAIAPAANMTAEEAPRRATASTSAMKRGANPGLTTAPVTIEAEPVDRAEILGTIREIVRERARSRAERSESGKHDGKDRDKRRGRKRGDDKDGEDH